MYWILSLALSASPDAGPVNIDSAEVAMRAGRFEEALSSGQRFLTSSVADEQVRSHRVVGVAEIGLADQGAADSASKLRDAVTHLVAYHAAHPSELFVQAKLGEAYLRTGSLDAGLTLIDPLIAEAAIPDVFVWEALATAKQQKSDAAGARLAAKACLRLDDAQASCRAVLAAVGEGSPRHKAKK